MKFERFVGIDWSGAEKPKKGIQVAEVIVGEPTPKLTEPGNYHFNWRRQDVFDYVMALAKDSMPTIIGLDFSFSLPYIDRDAYFPEAENPPKTALGLWSLVETQCEGIDDFYGGNFIKPGGKYSKYFMWQTGRGSSYAERYRASERQARYMGYNPTSTFKCVGPGQVGTGAMAGMRWLLSLKNILGDSIQIWPFDANETANLRIVEIYPRIFLRQFDAENLIWNSDDERDALISSKALSEIANMPESWQIDEAANVLAKEGWIFGVR